MKLSQTQSLVATYRFELEEGAIPVAPPASQEALEQLVQTCPGEIVLSSRDPAVSEGTRIWRAGSKLLAAATLVAQRTELANLAETLTSLFPGSNCCVFAVETTTPVAPPRVSGERTRGMKQFTGFARHPDLTDGEFEHLWLEQHREVAIETQSTFGYVRHKVQEVLAGTDPLAWNAIVEEHFPTEAMTNLHAFYAADSDEDLRSRMNRMIESVKGFIDFDSLEYTQMSEYTLRQSC